MTVRTSSDLHLIDTCGWIELAVEGPLAERFAPYFLDVARLVVPTVVQYELYRWVCRERDETTALELIGLTEQAKVVPVSSAIALLAADLAFQHRLAMADALIYATARQERLELVTCDDHFASLPGVQFFARSG